ncbi:hypothetical protein D1872_182400 [compost metagenome]
MTGFSLLFTMDGWAWTKYFGSYTDLTSFLYGNPYVDGVTLGFSLIFIVLHLAVMHYEKSPAIHMDNGA